MMKLVNVYKSFGENRVLEDLSLEFEGGGRYVIYGASGCGKTTVLRILMGLEKPDRGELLDVPSRVSAVFQEDRLISTLTAVGCIKMAVPSSISLNTVLAHLAELGLEGHCTKPVSELSGGMRRRVAIVRAVLAKGKIIFLDEAFTGLDTDTKKLAAEYILRHLNGRGIIAVSHSSEDAEMLDATRIELKKVPEV